MENTTIKSGYALPSPLPTYSPQHWFTFLFRFNQTDTIRKLYPMIILICIYSGLVAYLEMEVWQHPTFQLFGAATFQLLPISFIT